MIIDGKSIAAEVIARTKVRAAALPKQPSFLAIAIAPTAATRSYLKIKGRQAEAAGIRMVVEELPDTATTEDIIAVMTSAAEDALIVQLPLPEHVDLMRVLEAIPRDKDADVLSPASRNAQGEDVLMHPIAASVQDILGRASISIEGSYVTVVGQGWLVGQPVSSYLEHSGAHVTRVTRESGDVAEACQNADIVISGTGVPGLISADRIKEGAAVIDIGTSELGGSIAGDVDPAVAAKAGLFTPVPGGVGPVAVAYLMENVVTLASRASLRNP